ncbi:hypothetical protein HMPREF1486_03121 [Streptomyces sp. HPH0547]|nr:hypothetical protein HMPREF1486_03121 [Streptomyces sp. HPH0547]
MGGDEINGYDVFEEETVSSAEPDEDTGDEEG